MKLPLALLAKFIELPTKSISELRAIFDDLGLEVKDIENDGENAVFNIETLANRGDHLYALGIARELSARTLSTVKYPALAETLPDRKVSLTVKNNTDKCLRYALLELAISGSMMPRPEISSFIGGEGAHPLVDLLNYIQLEIGQPMHAFDRDKVEGEIIVKLTDQEEKIDALDGKAYSAPKGSIVICDSKKVIAVAGVIGCSNSMITDATNRVVVESAAFDPVTVRKTAKSMGISTDASYAFERGTDIEMVQKALKRLIHLCASGANGSVMQTVGCIVLEKQDSKKVIIDLDIGVVRKHLNAPRLESVEIVSRLKHLGFIIAETEDDKKFKVTVPSWRQIDIATSEDLVEEVARTIGLGKVRLELPPLDYYTPELNETETLLSKVEPTLIGNGFLEVVTKGFYSQTEVDIIKSLDNDLASHHIAIRNAVDSSYSHMKLSNILHLAKLANQNHRRGILSVKVYEVGRLFSLANNKKSKYEYESDFLTLAVSGRWYDNEWRKAPTRDELLICLKGVLESLIRAIGNSLSVAESRHPLLHSGCQATLKIGRANVGVFGLLHPYIKEKLDLKHDMIYAELECDALARCIKTREYSQYSEYPAIRRDITLLINKKEQAAKVLSYINECNSSNLNDVRLVDDFQKSGEDYRRVTYRLTFQSLDRTMESAEVDQAMSDILSFLSAQYKLELCA
jgi:phenylalanyl-tRNA synthetase beta chain